MLSTEALQDWLRIACRGGYAGAVLSLELELSARSVCDDACPEPAFPLHVVADPKRRAQIAHARLQEAAAQQDFDTFRANLVGLDPVNYAPAWQLARSFAEVVIRAEALRHVAFWIAAYFKGTDDAARIIGEATNDKSPADAIRALEDQFGNLIDASTGVRYA
jgi:hypothetical protein